MKTEDRFFEISICGCCLIITANGDHSGCEGNCENRECDDQCDHGCSATFGYDRPENAGQRLTASFVGCTSDHDDGCACGEGHFSWSACEWCGQIAGQRYDVYGEDLRAHQWPCGCLINEGDAHRVGCPEHPKGQKGHLR